MMFEASCTVNTQSVSSHSVVKPVLKSMQSHGAHSIFLHLQTHGCNRIKAFGLWEFQTKTCIFSLIITKSMRLKALAILMAILQAPPRHVRHYSCISAKQSTSNSYFCVLNSEKSFGCYQKKYSMYFCFSHCPSVTKSWRSVGTIKSSRMHSSYIIFQMSFFSL